MKTFTPTLVALLGLYEDVHAAGPLAPELKVSVSASASLLSSVSYTKHPTNLGNNSKMGQSYSTTNAIAQCEALKDAGLTHIYTQDDEQYKARTESYWSVSAQLAPKCIVQPVSTEEVATAIKTLGAENASKFAVRSGGHTTWAGSNNINDGVTIDLGLMNDTTYDEAANLAKIQPGNRWGGVYGALEPHGVTVAGGRASSVGVAGFLTGGGNTFFTAQRGFACDQVKNYEVVLSSG